MTRTVAPKSHRQDRDDVIRTRQPRPGLRRQGTRQGIVRAALREVS